VQFPIIIGLRRSRFLDSVLLLVVVLATAATLGFQCPWPVRTGLLFAITVLAMQAWRALSPSIKTIRLEHNGEIFVEHAGEAGFVRASPKPGATVHPWVSVVGLRTVDGRSATLIAAVDSQSRADFRRLRLFLRWQADFSVPTDAA
jgi:toxin CptA